MILGRESQTRCSNVVEVSLSQTIAATAPIRIAYTEAFLLAVGIIQVYPIEGFYRPEERGSSSLGPYRKRQLDRIAGSGRGLLEDPGVSQINDFRDQGQIVAAEALRPLPFVAILVESGHGDVVPLAVGSLVFPDRCFHGSETNLMGRCVLGRCCVLVRHVQVPFCWTCPGYPPHGYWTFGVPIPASREVLTASLPS